MITPDTNNQQPCCGASAIPSNFHHWEDCPDWVFDEAGRFWRSRHTLEPEEPAAEPQELDQ